MRELSASPMIALRRQYFLSYAAIGSVTPLLTVFLRDEGGFSFFEIGIALALMGIPTLTSPPLLTLLADRNIDPRRLLGGAAVCSAIVLTTMFFTQNFPLTLVLFFFHGLAAVAMIPLQDGYFFSLAEERRQRGEATVEYPTVRIWGTLGYIVPSLLLYYPLLRGAEVRAILPCAVFFCLLTLINSFTLPSTASRAVKKVIKSRVPSGEALRMLYGPNVRWLAIGLFFAYFAAMNYYTFIGNYLDEVVRIPKPYIGLIIVFGVLIEVFCTLSMPWLQKWFRLKGIILIGFCCMAGRMLLLAWFPTPLTAVLTQLGHGFEVLALYVSPVMFLNRLASNSFRNSIQGVFSMSVSGTARVSGCLLAAFVAGHFGMKANFLIGGVLGIFGFLIIALLFSRIPRPEEQLVDSPVQPETP